MRKSRIILLIDDNPDLIEIVEVILQQAGFLVASAAAVKGGLAAMEDPRVGVVLTDLCMPNGGGQVVIEKAKARQPPIPVLVMTADSTVDESLLKLVDGVFHKPIDFPKLVATLDALLTVTK